ncbi:type III toxin-antitoxin system TenpIN family toxin [Saccharibacillus sp. JS10]|uniref:type III toxin-antitoxin system TenpIN family toxin n=1 Tax=Saccharibacillus sp. JS10 TaxID=2950552 RepID=UPI00210A667D|nr:hypothetical protein [Saccharibacillus sp. JS10]MCQ4087372.1 hypothetical protein [Saccharibacillus sp. JS10]
MTYLVNNDFGYVHLNTQFYADYAHCREIMTDADRQYLHLIVQHRDNTFLIPFRTDLRHYIGFRFSERDRKGLDYTKAVVINDLSKYALPSLKPIPQYQHDLIVRNFPQIRRKFCKYVDQYCHAVQANDSRVLERMNSKYSALQYFHKEFEL